MDCIFCNTSAAPSARFCSHCGARLALEEASGGSPAFDDVLVDRPSFATMVAPTPNMICVLDVLENRYSYVNEALVRFLGFTRDQLMAADGARVVVGRVHPEDLHAISGHENLLQLSAGGTNPDDRHVEEFEYRLQDADGRWRWVHSWVRVFARTADGRVSQMLGIAHDITERKESEYTLLLNERRFRLALDVASMLSWDWTIGTNEVAFSQDYGAFYGFPHTGVIVPNDETILEPVHPDDRAPLMDAFHESVRTGRDFQIEFRGPMRQGEQSWYVTLGRIVETRDGQPQRMIGITHDITHRKQVEEALGRKNEQLERRVRKRAAELLEVVEDVQRLLTERDAIEKSLRLAQFSIDRAIDSVFWIGPNGQILYVNDATCRSLGYSREELLGKTVSDIDSNFPAEAWPARWEDLKQRGSISLESSLRTKDGRLIDIEVTANYVAFEGREYNCATVRDITDHKRAERLLRQSEDRFHLITTTIQDVFWVADAEIAKNHYISPAYEQIWGRSCQGLIENAYSFFDTIHPEDRERVFSNLAAKVEKRPFEHEYRIIRPDGSIRWIHDRGFPVAATAMTEACYVGCAQDITERKQAEQALWERETVLLQSQRIACIGSWSVELTTDNVIWTDETYRLYGVSRETFVPSAEAISALAHPDDRGPLQGHVEAFLAGKTPGALEFRVLLPDGQERVLCGQGEMFRDDTGRPAQMIGTVQDITDRKRAEQALWERETLLSQSQRIAHMGSWSVDLATDHVTWTDETYHLCGVSPETFVPSAKAIIGLVHPDDRGAVRERIQAYLAGESPGPLEFRVPLPDGQERVLSGDGELFRDDSGRPARIIGTVQDITDRKRAEQSLRLAQFSIDRAACPIFWDGPDAKIHYVNEAACRMLEYSREELTRMTICDIDPQVSSPAKYAAIWETLPRQGSLNFETQLVTKGGRVLDVEVTTNLIEYEGRELDCAMVRDITERKRVEQSLRIAQFSIDRAACPIFWDGPDAKIHYVNEAACRMLGYSREELTRMTICDIDPLISSPATYAAGWAALPRQGSLTFETKQVTKDGRVLDVEVTSNLIEYEGRELDCAMVRDITERKRVEQSLRESEQRNRTILRTAMEGFWRNDLQGRLLEVNEAYCRMSGYSEQELLAMSVPDLEAAETSADVAAHMQKIVGQGADRFESWHRRKDGSTYPIEVSVQYRPEARHFFAFLRDITERKHAEQSLRESEQRNRTILRTAMDGFWRLDLQGRVLEVNEAFCRMSGYTEPELLVMNVSDLEAIETGADTAAHTQTIIAQGSDRFESRHRRKDGSTYPIEVSVQYRPVDGGQMFAFLRDIAERKQAESQANELRDALTHSKRVSILGEIASGLAHELNQPLAAIHLEANTALFLAKELDAPGLPDCLRRVSEQSFRAGEIIRRMRSFSRRSSPHRAPDDINRLVREVLMMLGNNLSEHAVTVDLNLAESLPQIMVDGIQIQQVLVNLIRNAGEAMAQNVDAARVLCLRTERVESEVRVSVSDTGCGLDPAIAAKLFFPFQTTKSTGLGLGLSICRTLVEAHNGRIEVRSNPGRGTTFSFTIPMAP